MAKAVAKKALDGLARYIGKCVCIRTVTYHYTGKVESVDGGFVRLSTAAWIADSGRWHQALKDGSWSEVEPYPEDVLVAIPAIVDVTQIREAPKAQK
jgi:hypothetical protein